MAHKLKLKIIFSIISFAFMPSSLVYAAGDAVIFYPDSKELSVAGECAKSQVLILIYYADSDKVWGSGNVRCESGQYQYKQDLSSWDIADGEFEVEVIDGGYKEKTEKEKQGKAPGKKEKIVISGMEEFKSNQRNQEKQNLPAGEVVNYQASSSVGAVSSSSLTSTSSPDVEKRDEAIQLLDGILEKVFNIVQDIKEAAQKFIVIIAKTIKTTTLAAVQIFTNTLAILPDGKIIVPEGENQIAGKGVILSGAFETLISNTQVATSSKIFVTPLTTTDAPLVVVEKISGKGFKVAMPRTSDKDIVFDWLMIDAYSVLSEAGVPASPNLAEVEISTSTVQSAPLPDVNVENTAYSTPIAPVEEPAIIIEESATSTPIVPVEEPAIIIEESATSTPIVPVEESAIIIEESATSTPIQ